MLDTALNPVATQPATSTPKKSSAKQSPPSFDLDEDITKFTISFVDDDGKGCSCQLSFKELDDTTESDMDNSGDDQHGMDMFEKMCSVPKYIVFEDELLKLFKCCAICGEGVLERDLFKKGSALKITTLCESFHSKEWVSQPTLKIVNLLLSGAILFKGNTFLSHVSKVNLAFPSESD